MNFNRDSTHCRSVRAAMVHFAMAIQGLHCVALFTRVLSEPLQISDAFALRKQPDAFDVARRRVRHACGATASAVSI
jgi:hypothetical protein